MAAICENLQLACGLCRVGVYTIWRRLCCKKQAPPRPDIPVICIGLDNSGKTTILNMLIGDSLEETQPTSGFSINAVMLESAILNVKEVGGGDKVRPYWDKYFMGSQGVIFVVDSASSNEELELAKMELHKAVTNSQLKGLPCLVLANCQDKSDARSVNEVACALETEKLTGDRKLMVNGCSKTDKQGLRNILNKFCLLLQGKEVPKEEDESANIKKKEENRV